MICKKCGNQVADGMKFCPECGRAMTAQPDEVLSGEIVETQGNASGNNNRTFSSQNAAENVGKVMDQAKDIKRKYNIGHLGVLAASILTLIAMYMPNSGIAEKSIVNLLSLQERNGWANGGYGANFDGRTYALILIALLAVTLVLGYFRKNFLMIIFSIASLAWVIYMLKYSNGSLLSGLGLLLFPVGGILLVVSSIAAFSIGRKQQA